MLILPVNTIKIGHMNLERLPLTSMENRHVQYIHSRSCYVLRFAKQDMVHLFALCVHITFYVDYATSRVQ